MMKRPILLLSGLLVLLLAPLPGRGQTPAQEEAQPNRVTYYQQFSGETTLRDGRVVEVDMRTWIVRGGVELDELPMEIDGPMIVQLRGGELETTISGEREERQEDAFWVVPRGVRMGLETEDDSAVFDTILIRER